MRKIDHKSASEALQSFASRFDAQQLLWNGRKLQGLKVVCRNVLMKAGYKEAEANEMVKEQVKKLFGSLI